MMSEEIHSLLPNQTGVKNLQSSSGELAEQFGTQGILIAILRARQSCIMPALMAPQIKKMIWLIMLIMLIIAWMIITS